MVGVSVGLLMGSYPSVEAAHWWWTGRSFQRLATFPVINNYCRPNAVNACFDRAAVAEIVAASDNGKLLIYTDSANDAVGFVDISKPKHPEAGGVVEVGGEPTSVAVNGRYALVGVNTSPNFVNPSGHLTVIDLRTKSIVPGAEALDLGGQPDSIAVSPSGRYAAVVIENERDEDLGTGEPPQLPAGKLVRVTLSPRHQPDRWDFDDIDLTGLADLFPSDPEPEYVDINDRDIAVVSLQENNHVVLVDLRKAEVIDDFTAGTVDLSNVDIADDGVINFDSSLVGVPREPDAVSWISDWLFASADEGDLNGGSRGFTLFWKNGHVAFSSASTFDSIGGHVGHYPEGRSDAKGTEPEAVEYGKFQGQHFLFVGSERGSFVGVYTLGLGGPELDQVLPTGFGPEGLLAIENRNLFVVASEEDDPEERTFRGSISIYGYERGKATYPTITSLSAPNGTAIPWAALSGLGAHPTDRDLAYSVSDSAFAVGFIYPMNTRSGPAWITDRIAVTGADDLDLEGVAVRSDGTLWLASEGNANGSRPNRIFRADPVTGTVIGPVIFLPASVDARRTGNGFEGIAVTGTVGVDEKVYVAFQREWAGDPAGKVRIGVHDVASGNWTFLYYPLDAVQSPNGGWVGLSEIVALRDGGFAVIERDNQSGREARIKKIYRFSTNGKTPHPDCVGTCDFPTVDKALVRDLIPYLEAPGGEIIEKVEGLAVTADGRTLIHTDNDAVDGSNGETQYIDLGRRILW
jgi:hypothetical protein